MDDGVTVRLQFDDVPDLLEADLDENMDKESEISLTPMKPKSTKSKK